MKELAITPRGSQADVKLVVNWQAKVWNPPDAKSKWLGMDRARRGSSAAPATDARHDPEVRRRWMDLMPGRRRSELDTGVAATKGGSPD